MSEFDAEASVEQDASSFQTEEQTASEVEEQERQEADVEHADAAYKLEEPGEPGVFSPEVLDDLNARIADAAEPHREVSGPELGLVAPDEHVQVEVGDDDDEDGQAESLEQERIVKDLAESGQLFEKGGPIGDWTGDRADLSDGVDGLFLAERSKQTGEKLF
jgi:hypothetical protein